MAEALAFTLPLEEARQRVEEYDFRALSPSLRFGTASDRYAGWIGQIYPESYRSEVSTRSRKLGGKTFKERTLPVRSVEDYFRHFGVLELDFTYYRALLDEDGKPTNNYFVLEQYASLAPGEALFLLKAPQEFFTRTLRRSRDGKTVYEDNPSFLDARGYVAQFLEPAASILGDQLAGVIFEQSYQRVSDSPSIEQHVAELDRFFVDIPDDVQSHIEIRSPHLLVPPYFAWLESNGIGFVFSHWTWLQPLRQQWQRCEGRFSAANGEAVVRLLTPLRMSYAEAYAQAYPFDKPVDAIVNSNGGRDMILDVTALAFQAGSQHATLNIIANNRAWGNSPALARAIATSILEFSENGGV